MPRKNFTFRIDEATVEATKQKAEESGISLNQFVEAALQGSTPFQPATLESMDAKLNQILKILETSRTQRKQSKSG